MKEYELRIDGSEICLNSNDEVQVDGNDIGMLGKN